MAQKDIVDQLRWRIEELRSKGKKPEYIELSPSSYYDLFDAYVGMTPGFPPEAKITSFMDLPLRILDEVPDNYYHANVISS